MQDVPAERMGSFMMTAPRHASAIPSFEELARMPDAAIDIAVGAASIAKDVYPRLDVRAVLAELEGLAGPLVGGALGALPAPEQAEAIGGRFRELGFRGNEEDYGDPRNSLLPDVLSRRLGLPITLALVYCEIARRAGVLARGIAFPGHFLVRVDGDAVDDDAERPVVIDPFAGARLVDDVAAKSFLQRAIGDGAELHPALFVAADPRSTLVRMLANLKSAWASRGEYARAFIAIDRMVTLVPDSARLLRERAAAALVLGATELARADLRRVIELEPQAPDVPTLTERLAKLGQVSRSRPN